jgi:hypothetical protein
MVLSLLTYTILGSSKPARVARKLEMTFRLHQVPLVVTAVVMAGAGSGSADAASLPHRMTARFACEQVQEVTISIAQQAAALRFWTPRRMDAVGSPNRAALARITGNGIRSGHRPKSLYTYACGMSAQSAPVQPAIDGKRGFRGYPSVGRLFFKGDGVLSETCTASVINNSGKKQPKGGTLLILTAAHCIDGTLMRLPYYSTDFAFVPDWRKGKEQFGTWSIRKYYIYKKWLECPLPPMDCHTDPEFDFAIMIVAPRKGVHVGAVTGANGWVEPVPRRMKDIRIVGYPASSAVPLLSRTNTVTVTKNGISYRTGHTPGFGDGASGGPWFKSVESGGVGIIIGDTGGFQQGGDDPTPSYSDVWDSTYANLVAQARKNE